MPRSYGTTNAAPYATPPAVGSAGDTYFDTGRKQLNLSDGTQWIPQAGSPQVYWHGNISGPSGSFTHDVWTLLSLTQAMANNASLASGTNITMPLAGKYCVQAQFGAGNAAAAVGNSFVRINQYSSTGTLKVSKDQTGSSTASSGGPMEASITAIFDVAAGDYFQIYGYVGTSTATNLDTRSWVTVTSVGGATAPDQASYAYLGATASATLGTDVLVNVVWNLTRYNNFSLASGGQRITPAVAGKYQVTAQLGYNQGATASLYTRCNISQYNSGGGLITQQTGVGNAIAVNGYGQAITDGEFDMAVGDYLVIAGASQAAGGIIHNSSYCTVVPVGGAKGDQGPDIAAAQSSYFLASQSGGQSVAAAGTTITPWTTIINNGFTVSGSNIICNQAGRYRVAVQIGGTCGTTSSQYRITNIYQFSSTNAQKALRNLVNNGVPANQWGTWFAETIFDMVAGDYVQIQLLADQTSTTDGSGRNQIEITPIGGVKGDTGPQGPDVTLVQSSYAYLALSSAAMVSNAANIMTWGAAAPPASFINGFTLAGSGTQIVASQAGRYRVQVEATVTSTGVQNSVALQLSQYNSSNTLITSHTLTGSGSSSANYYMGPSHEAQFNMAAGDYISAYITPALSGGTVDTSGKTTISITPVGGTKGDTGPAGAAGTPGGPVPVGGISGQILTKNSNTDGDVSWFSRTLGYVEDTSGTARTFGAVTDITGMSVTVNIIAGHRIRISFFAARIQNDTTANQAVWIMIREGSTTIQQAYVSEVLATGSGGGNYVQMSVILTPSAGSHTYKVSGVRNGGSDTHYVTGTVNQPMYLLVEDIT